MSSSPSSISFIKMVTLHSWSHRIYSTVFLKPVIVYSSQKDEPYRVTHCASSTRGKEKEVVCVCVFVYSCFTCVHMYTFKQ